MKRIAVLLALLIACLQLPTTARAAEPTPFAKGTKSLTLSGSYIQHIRFSIDELENVDLSAGYFIWDNNSLNLELQGYHANQDSDSDAYIVGLGLTGRWHFYRGNRWSLFIDGGGGISYADQEFPEYMGGGTNFNFTGKVGGGGTYQIGDRTHLIGGVRYFHLSNGQIRGSDDNPTFDGIQFWGGVMWTW